MTAWQERKVDKQIAFLSKFKATEPAPAYVEPVGPPAPWKIYEAVVFAGTGTKPPMDSFRFARMKHADRLEAIEFYRKRVAQQEMVRVRACEAIEAEARRELERERRLLPDLEARLGAW